MNRVPMPMLEIGEDLEDEVKEALIGLMPHLVIVDESEIPTEPKILSAPVVAEGDVKQALLNIATLAGSCFDEMREDAADEDLELSKHVRDASLACGRLKRYILHRL